MLKHLQAVSSHSYGFAPTCPRLGGTCPNVLESNNPHWSPSSWALAHMHKAQQTWEGLTALPNGSSGIHTAADTVQRSGDSLDTAEECEACSAASQVQKLCQGHLNAPSRAETEALHKHRLGQVTVRKGPGPKQGSRSGRLIFQNILQDSTSEPQSASPDGGLALSKRNGVLAFQTLKGALEFIIL